MTEQPQDSTFKERAKRYEQAARAAKALAWFDSGEGAGVLVNDPPFVVQLTHPTCRFMGANPPPDEGHARAEWFIREAVKRYASQIIDAAIAEAMAVLAQFEGRGE